MKRIQFLEAWGHPTRNEIYGPGEVYVVSDFVASCLLQSGTVELVAEPEAPGASACNCVKSQVNL